MKKGFFLLIPIFIFLACEPSKNPEEGGITSQNRDFGVVEDSAMVVTAHPIASKIGADIMKSGGNAYDAAVAVQFALAVVFPEAGNIGGGGFAVIRTKDGEIASIDFREKAPAKAHKDMYLEEGGEVNRKKSVVGHLAAGVPGSVSGMWELHQKYGNKPWRDLIQPALEVAHYGFLLSSYGAENLNEKQEVFKETNQYKPWVIKEDLWQEGDSIVQPELAAVLGQIRDNGKDGFYKGIVADLIWKEMLRGGGLITKEDLANYQAKWRKPLEGTYRSHRVISMPPPSSGGVAILQMLQGAEEFDLKKYGHNSAKSIHILTELERRVFADRATYLGDPDYYDVPIEMLLNNDYNEKRFANINLDAKTPSQEIKEGNVEIIESMETTHFSIVDPMGNAVSVTTTVNGFYGCKVMVKGGGFFLNNEMDDFSAKPGVPNQFGLVGGEANSIQPGKRMLSSMTPTIVEKNGNLFMVTGTPGGSTIITSVFQNILNVIDHGMTMQEAVNAKRMHHQWLPDEVYVESNTLSKKDSLSLVALGHKLKVRSPWGRVDAILLREDGQLEGAADQRAEDIAVGF